MARPLYIICAESMSLDQNTNLVSLFHVLEGFTVQFETTPKTDGQSKSDTLPVNVASPKFYSCAVWMKDANDGPEDEYEYETVATSPGGEELTVNAGSFSFTKTFYRIQMGFVLAKPFQQSGDFVVCSKIRRKGTDEWLVQEYPIPITVTVGDETSRETESQ